MKNSITRIDALNFAIDELSKGGQVDAEYTEVVAVLAKIRDSIAKANAYKPEHKTPTKVQEQNEVLKADILVSLATGEHKTVTELIAAVPSLAGMTTQKVSALMRLLKLENKVDKETVKGKTYFYMI